jgi:hypothetical protein
LCFCLNLISKIVSWTSFHWVLGAATPHWPDQCNCASSKHCSNQITIAQGKLQHISV